MLDQSLKHIVKNTFINFNKLIFNSKFKIKQMNSKCFKNDKKKNNKSLKRIS